jgi:hypothetical protein
MLPDGNKSKPPLYSEKGIDRIWAQWVRLGLRAGVNPWSHEVDTERLIVETTTAGRIEGRAFKALLTFLRDYGDLVNTHRLCAILNDADVPVLGAALDIALKHGGAQHYKTVLKKCWPYKDPQLFSTIYIEYETVAEIKMKNTSPVYRKWGLYENMEEFYDDAWRGRKLVLKDNFNLRIRARLGPNRLAQLLIALHGAVHRGVVNTLKPKHMVL